MKGSLRVFAESLVLRACHYVERIDARRAGRDDRAAKLHRRGLVEGALVAGRYRLTAMLGEGAMGQVWLARDELEQRDAALKVMRAGSSSAAHRNREAESRAAEIAFKHEFYTMTKLQHPNTVKVFDYGVLEGGDRFITMEVVSGKDLSDLLVKGPLELAQIYRVLIDLANVLGFVHSRRFVHCDIKSSNVRMTDAGSVRLMDFGMMHQLGLAAGGTLKGTPYYMAPEIPRGGVIDQRTDLYSLGVLAFELATGRYPFTGRSLAEIFAAHMERPPPRVSELRKVPERFEDLVARLLEKDPARRHHDCAELLRHLSDLTGASVDVSDYGAQTSYLHCAELIGRVKEQAALDRALKRLREGEGESVFLSAPAGVGKTRLLQEFRLKVKMAEVPFVVGQCRAEGQLPLAPLVDALSQLIPLSSPELLAKHAPVLSSVLPRMAPHGKPAPGAPPPSKPQVFDALRGWLTDLSLARPFLLCLEDLHWADSVTLEHLNVILRELHKKPAMVLATFRSDEVDRLSTVFQTVDEGLTRRLELPDLSLDEAKALLTAMLGAMEVPPSFIERLHEVTRGNAFFITETMRSLIEQGELRIVSGRWVPRAAASEIPLPRSTFEVIVGRIASLPELSLRFLRSVAPLGRVLDLPLLRRISEQPDEQLFRLLDELIERQFVERSEGQFYFSHDMVRESAYRDTPEAERKAAHQRIAEAIEEVHRKSLTPHVGALAHHYARGTDRKKAIHYLLAAADQAVQRRAMLQTTTLLASAADLLEAEADPRLEAQLVGTWGRIIELSWAAHPPSCTRYGSKLFSHWERTMDMPAAVAAFHATNRPLMARRDVFARRRLRRLWSDQPFDPKSRDPLHVVPKLFAFRRMVAQAYSSMGDDKNVLAVVERQYADNPDPGPFRAMATLGKGILLLNAGHWTTMASGMLEAKAWFEEHLERVGVMPLALWRDYVMTIHFLVLEQAMTGTPIDPDLQRLGFELCDRIDFPEARWFLNASSAARAAIAGDPAAMQEKYDWLVEMNRRLGYPQVHDTRLAIWVSVYWVYRRELELAEATVGKLEMSHKKLPYDAAMRRYALVHRAIFSALTRPPEEARASVESARAAVDEVPSFRLKGHLLCAESRVLLQLGDREAALARAEEALALGRTEPTASPWGEIVGLRAVADAAGGERGADLARESAELAKKWDLPLQEGLSWLSLAEVALPFDRPRAMEALGLADELFARLKAKELRAAAADLRRRAEEVGAEAAPAPGEA